MAPAGLGKALAELVEVEDGRDMVTEEPWTECGMLEKRDRWWASKRYEGRGECLYAGGEPWGPRTGLEGTGSSWDRYG